MQTVLLIFHLIVCAGLIGLVLMQRSEGGALGMGGGGSNSIMSGRGAASALARATTIAGIVFFCTSIVLALLAGQGFEDRGRSVTDQAVATRSAPMSLETAPAAAAAAPNTLDVASEGAALAPSPQAAFERAGPASAAAQPVAATPEPRQIAGTVAPRPPAAQPRPTAAAPAPAEPAPEPVVETLAEDTPLAASPEQPRRRAGPDQ